MPSAVLVINSSFFSSFNPTQLKIHYLMIKPVLGKNMNFLNSCIIFKLLVGKHYPLAVNCVIITVNSVFSFSTRMPL